MKTSIKAIVLATTACSVTLPAVTQAADFQYDGIELSYSLAEVDESGPFSQYDLDGATIEINYSIRPHIVLGGGYLSATGKPDITFNDGSREQVKNSITGPFVLAFYHAEFNEKMAYKVGARYEKFKSEFTSSNVTGLGQLTDDDASKSVIGGVRYQFNEQIELDVNVDYDLDAEDGQDKLSYEVGARYQVLPDLDVSLNVDFVNGGRILRASVKKYLDFSR